ncbi:MAG: type II toxin-antitoxin system HigB family toxin [Pyrinomonadaceae bacterium]
MHIISKKALIEFWQKRSEAKEPLLAWYKITKGSSWKSLAEVKKSFPHADLVGECTVFNIKGNDYRLISVIKYRTQRVYILHVLTHAAYDKEKWKDDCNC